MGNINKTKKVNILNNHINNIDATKIRRKSNKII